MNNQTVEELKKRGLDKCYVAIYCTEVEILLQNESEIGKIHKLNVLYGCDVRGRRKYICCVLDTSITKTSDWYDVFQMIKKRNVEKIVYGIVPENKKLRDAIKLSYPEIELKEPYIKLIKGLDMLNKNSIYRNKSMLEIRNLYLAKNLEEYEKRLEEFNNKYENSPFILEYFNDEISHLEEVIREHRKLKKLIFPIYFIKSIYEQFSKLGKTKNYKNIDDFIESAIPIIKTSESHTYCSGEDWLEIINGLYDEKKESIMKYI